MIYSTAEPHQGLRRWVRHYWWLESDRGLSDDHLPLAPDGAFELVVHLAEPPEHQRAGHWQTQAGEILVGEIQRPTTLRAEGRVRCVGVHFAPGGVRAFFAEPATELCDRMTALDDLSRPLPRLVDRIDPEGGLAAAALVLDRVLLKRLSAEMPSERVQRLIHGLGIVPGRAPVSDLASAAGTSTRQLERILKPVLGVSPRRYLRVVRFHRALTALLEGDTDAALAHYYDQPHFLRDVREFVRSPVAALTTASDQLNRYFHARRPVRPAVSR